MFYYPICKQLEISVVMNYIHQFNALNTFIFKSKDTFSKCAKCYTCNMQYANKI